MGFGHFLGLVALTLSLLSCKQIGKANRTGFVLGPTNDMLKLKPQNESAKIKSWFKSTVLISTELIHEGKRKFCSGVLIGPEEGDGEDELRVLSNFHCFAQTNEEGDVNREFLPEACANTRVYFGFDQDSADSVQTVKCAEGTLIGDFTGDLSVFKLAESVPKGFKALEIWTEPEIPNNRKAAIIHHPDIKDRFTPISETNETLPAASITKDNCNTRGDFATDEWHLDHTLPYSVKHTCDLVHGSSGSPLIDYESGKILGVNWGGIEIKYKDEKKKINAATKGFYINAFLSGKLAPIKERSDRLARDAALKRDQKHRANGGKIGVEINDALCGAIDSQSKADFRGLWLILILLAPVVLPFTRRLVS